MNSDSQWIITVICDVCACMQPCLNGSAQAQAAARPKVKTKWPMNVRGEDLSQAPPALCPPFPSPSRLYIRCPHADANHIANHTERAWSLWLGISCCGISLFLSLGLCSALGSTSDRISGDNYRLACKYAESIRFCLSDTTLVWNGTN